MSVFGNLLTPKEEINGDSLIVKKNGRVMREELSKLDWYNRQEIYTYVEMNLMDLLYNMSEDQDIYSEFSYRPELYVTIDTVLKQNGSIEIPKNHAIRLNNCMYAFLVYMPSRLPDHIYKIAEDAIVSISKVINKEVYRRLDFTDVINEDLLRELPICRFSSLYDHLNIMRVNFSIMNRMNPKTTDEEDLIDIYKELFFDIEDKLFLYSMEETFVLDGLDTDRRWMYDICTNTLLMILNEKPMSYIKSTLIKYSQNCLTKQLTLDKVRCSLLQLSADYDKIRYIAEELKEQGLYII